MWRGRRDRRPLLCAVVFGRARLRQTTTSVTIPARAAYPHAAAQTRIASVARIRLDLQIQGRAGDGLNARERLSAAKIRLGGSDDARGEYAAAPPRNVPRKLDGARGDKSGQTFVPSGIFTSS